MNERQVLEKAVEIISDHHHWTQGTYARNNKGNPVFPNSPKATRWCAVGVLEHLTDQDETLLDNVHALVTPHLMRLGCNSLLFVNDVLGRKAVINIFQDCIKDLTNT